jgi:acetyl-CoA carboxylase carboxyl transferase subunit alpha
MNPNFLDFEQPIAELDAKIQELRLASHGQAFNIEDEISTLQDKLKAKTAEIFRNLTPWQVAQLARHPARPYTLDYLGVIAEEFHELAGDRAFADDAAIVGGLARINGRSVVVIGHQKGRDTKSKIRRNFGMPRPEGYRKALRLMQMAERFSLPILTFIDTAGAWPGVDAEARGQSEAIARNLLEMSELNVPIVCSVIGEGGSGGALAIGVGDRTNMLQYSTYSVITPEGCASILWKSAEKAKDAADALGLTAPRLLELGLIDKVVREPLGGAHRNPRSMAIRLKAILVAQLDEFERLDTATLLAQRYKRLRRYGALVGGWSGAAARHARRTNDAPLLPTVSIARDIRRARVARDDTRDRRTSIACRDRCRADRGRTRPGRGLARSTVASVGPWFYRRSARRAARLHGALHARHERGATQRRQHRDSRRTHRRVARARSARRCDALESVRGCGGQHVRDDRQGAREHRDASGRYRARYSGRRRALLRQSHQENRNAGADRVRSRRENVRPERQSVSVRRGPDDGCARRRKRARRQTEEALVLAHRR